MFSCCSGPEETGAARPLASHKDHTRASVWEEIEQTGRSTVVESINRAVSEGGCECEMKNPSGRCCPDEVTQTVKQVLEQLSVSEAALKTTV